MIAERILEAVGLSAAPVAVKVIVVTVATGLGAKAGWLTVRRKTAALVAPSTYIRFILLLAVAAGAIVLAAARGLVTGGMGTQTVYALLLANLLEQVARLTVGE